VKLALHPRHGVSEFFVYFARGLERAPWQADAAALAEIVAQPGVGPEGDD